MKKLGVFIAAMFVLVQFSGCSSTSSPEDVALDTTDEKLFVWNGLNYWYFWQDDVADLADDRFGNNGKFSTFLNRFSNEEALFDQLLHRDDDFSWFIQDYKVHEEARLGRSKSFGFRFGLLRESPDNARVLGYVRYVVPDSPADNAGLKRGDVFNAVNGQILNLDNFQNLLSGDTYALSMAKVIDFVSSPRTYTIEGIDKEITLAAINLQENPIHLSKVIETEASRVGYLMYNSFRFNFHDELNQHFGDFKNAGIDDLVIDLRYNGGGALITSALLASLISGVSSNEIFAELIHGSKRDRATLHLIFWTRFPIFDDEGNFSRTDNINSLRMNRLYVLTSQNSASASEALINGLLPFGVEVILIGDVTAGKDEGSITVYDAPEANYSPRNDEERSEINPNHMRAMQPIIFKIFNKERADYPDGFLPDFQITEFDFLQDLPALGASNEPLLSVALSHIKGDGLPAVAKAQISDSPELVFDSADLGVLRDEIYLLPDDIERE